MNNPWGRAMRSGDHRGGSSGGPPLGLAVPRPIVMLTLVVAAMLLGVMGGCASPWSDAYVGERLAPLGPSARIVLEQAPTDLPIGLVEGPTGYRELGMGVLSANAPLFGTANVTAGVEAFAREIGATRVLWSRGDPIVSREEIEVPASPRRVRGTARPTGGGEPTEIDVMVTPPPGTRDVRTVTSRTVVVMARFFVEEPVAERTVPMGGRE